MGFGRLYRIPAQAQAQAPSPALVLVLVLASGLVLGGCGEGSGPFAFWEPDGDQRDLLDVDDILALGTNPPDDVHFYGSGRLQYGHLRLPDGPGPHPVAVVIHGGCWVNGTSLRFMDSFVDALRDAGVATWNLEFRRLGDQGGGWPGTFLDVGAGVDALRDLAAEHDLDLDRTAVVGHSSGGHLALWAAGRHRVAETSEIASLDPLPVGAVVSLAGPGDLEELLGVGGQGCGRDVVVGLVGGAPEEVPERWAAASPAALLPLDRTQRLVTGQYDDIFPPTLAEEYGLQAAVAGDDVETRVEADAGHFEVLDPSTTAFGTLRDLVLALLEVG